ncbi:MAG: hypothetical protein JW818_20230 [Pirellulales bacterium]|nr:hypothetical protein [Pirellulales bacterium]
MPSKGVGISAAAKLFSEYKKCPGDQSGHDWRVPAVKSRREFRTVNIDTNYWKSFVPARLATAIGAPGALTLWGNDPTAHRLLAEHIVVEVRTPTEDRGHKVVDGRLRPAKPDNHGFDCLVGAAVAASMLGVAVPGAEPTPKKRRRVRLSEIQRRKRNQ